jgi:hypothetical protein
MNGQRLATLLLIAAGFFGCKSKSHLTPVRTAPPTTQLTSARPTTSPLALREAEELRPMLYYIASDDLEGRGLQTTGIDKAADFIAQRFKEAGLRPMPALGQQYFQPFDVTVKTSIGGKTSLSINGKALKVDEDFRPVGFSAEGSLDAPIVFAGYSISAEQKYHYDDYSGADVKGKVVLAMRYEPHDDAGHSKFEKQGFSDEAALNQKARAAADHGAVALILVNPPKYHGEDRLVPFTRSFGDKSAIPVLMITQDVAEEMLKAGGAPDLKALQDQLDQLKPQTIELKEAKASGTVELLREQKKTKNVVGYLPGAGEYRGEYIVVGGHYDHLGRGEPGSLARNSKEIHNGADDNGSGTVAVMELAKKIAARGPLQRTVIFCCFSGEERGLLGSAYFVNHPPVPLEKIVAMLNLDMVGRVQNNTMFVGGAGTAEPFDALLEQADKASPLELKTAGGMLGSRGGIGPSDHESFALKKIPVLFLFSGMHADYHRPTDKPDKINYVGIAEAVDLSTSILDQLATMPKSAYVDKFDHSARAGTGGGGGGVRLGVIPDYGADESITGVKISGTMPDSPAAKAGLKDGDIIVQFKDSKIASLQDLFDQLSASKPGDKAKLAVLRAGQRLELEATLTAR